METVRLLHAATAASDGMGRCTVATAEHSRSRSSHVDSERGCCESGGTLYFRGIVTRLRHRLFAL
jgi:hypothetical protein